MPVFRSPAPPTTASARRSISTTPTATASSSAVAVPRRTGRSRRPARRWRCSSGRWTYRACWPSSTSSAVLNPRNAWKANRASARLGQGGARAAALDRVAGLAPGADALADVDDVVEPCPLQDRGRQAAAFAAAADRRDRAIAGQLVEVVGEVSVGDVQRAGDVLARVLGRVADVEHERRL